jgi:hypothetical protein
MNNHFESASVCEENEVEQMSENIDLPGEFVVWYHSITNNSWAQDSYINLCENLPNKSVSTVVDLTRIYSAFQHNVTAGMFFLMRKGIMPLWEDPNNKQGGVWSFKVVKRHSNEVWLQLTAAFVGNCLLSNPEDSYEITGISVSPKISNCVMKIWNRDRKKNSKNIFNNNVQYLEPSTLIYKENK